ncbi:MAG TPA: hypothetical protein PL045_02290 [Chitinophagaceae bacterium]|nr:hypothetical protein [Chitinophagaceae bacterium]
MNSPILLPILLLTFISCNHHESKLFNPPPFQFTDTPVTSSKPYKEDTLCKNKDTIIIQTPHTIDTLLKFNSSINKKKYFVTAEKIQLQEKLDFSNYEYKKKYITVTKEGVQKQGVNFAGHFCFVYWGCGSPCKLSAVVDMKTGIVYNGVPSSIGYAFEKNSKVIVVNPPDSSGWYNKNTPHHIPTQYVWTDKEFIEMKSSD